MIKDVRKFYFGDKPVDANSLQEFVKLLSDVFFIYGIDKSVKAQAKRSEGKTYYYQWVDICVFLFFLNLLILFRSILISIIRIHYARCLAIDTLFVYFHHYTICTFFEIH